MIFDMINLRQSVNKELLNNVKLYLSYIFCFNYYEQEGNHRNRKFCTKIKIGLDYDNYNK